MAAVLEVILKNQLIEMFDDILRLTSITGKQRCMLLLGKAITEEKDPHILMKALSEDLIEADIDKLTQDSDELFTYIFNCLTKKQIEHEIVKESLRNLYTQLCQEDKTTITDYVKQMKRICEKYNVLPLDNLSHNLS